MNSLLIDIKIKTKAKASLRSKKSVFNRAICIWNLVVKLTKFKVEFWQPVQIIKYNRTWCKSKASIFLSKTKSKVKLFYLWYKLSKSLIQFWEIWK